MVLGYMTNYKVYCASDIITHVFGDVGKKVVWKIIRNLLPTAKSRGVEKSTIALEKILNKTVIRS